MMDRTRLPSLSSLLAKVADSGGIVSFARFRTVGQASCERSVSAEPLASSDRLVSAYCPVRFVVLASEDGTGG